MTDLTTAGLIAALVGLFLVSELAAATLPLLIVIAVVPPHERPALAAVLAATDSRRRLHVWPALRTAVADRRRLRAGRYAAAGRPGPP
ncbi:hypothetical protein BJY16_008445 [Actinoplanes octamycinicus]|uniref:Uncharacterized protein n=1 Tax=Actinoplanes octamycinicus TaxID=135948 RepID=A0A7W7H6M5_9ACTN|nr:hypothetical protein [Actinoplanes octamycinicus]MBB4744986.1 hypothetical protein [Actinoplanes octamycinicus]GIE55572.1 hypothetical protein Aoc01nite_09740 [Actinoplanes octamycinicus]